MILSRFFFLVPVLAVAALLACPTASFAQAAPATDPCAKIGAVMQERVQIIQKIQGFKDKKPTAQEACSVFTKLASVNKTAVQSLEHDGSWCRAPANAAESLKQQQSQIEQGRSNACKAAEEQKKAASQPGLAGPQTGPIGGGDSLVGGPQKLPQGAL